MDGPAQGRGVQACEGPGDDPAHEAAHQGRKDGQPAVFARGFGDEAVSAAG